MQNALQGHTRSPWRATVRSQQARPATGRITPITSYHPAARCIRPASRSSPAGRRNVAAQVGKIAEAASSVKEKVKEVVEEVEEVVEDVVKDDDEVDEDEEVVAVPEPVGRTVALDEVILLQGFGWDSCKSNGWWNILKDNVPKIKESGVSHIWLPPPSQSVAPQGYLPGQLYNLNSKYGNKQQLQELIAALHEAGITVVADIVINHRCADEKDENGVWNNYRDDVNHKNLPVDWGQWAITSDDPEFNGQGNPDTGADYHAAPDLDHTNEGLQASLTEWLEWLKEDIGFDGWRYDFTKGYAAKYCEMYTRNTVGHEQFSVGENWVDLQWGEGLNYNQDGPRQILCDWLDQAGGVATFDFPTKGILAEAVKNCEYWRLIDANGKAPGLLGWWPSKAVTFVDNHDTGSTQQHWPFPHGSEETGYAYILTHPGVPTVLWEHYFDNQHLGGKIKELIDVRKRNGIKSRANLQILKAENDIYVARVDDKLVVKLGPRHDMGDLYPKEEEGWVMASCGKDYGVWEKKC